LLLIILDVCAFYTALLLAFFTRKFINIVFPNIIPLEFSLSHFLQFWWIPLTFLIFISYERLYVKRISFWDEIKEFTKALTIAIVMVLAIATLGKISERISRLTIVFLGFYSVLVYPVFRFLGKKILYKVGLWKENLIIIGAGRTATEIAKGIDDERHLGYNIIGFLDDDADKIGKEIVVGNKRYKVFGKIKNFKKFTNMLDIATVIIAIPSLSIDELTRLTNNVQRYAKRVLLIPDLRGIALVNTELHHLFMQQMFLLKINNNLKSMFNRAIKRSFDIAFSLLFLPLLLLFIAITGILIKLDSRGSAFLIQDRIGKNGKIFRCMKFRTMYENSDEILEDYLGNNDEARKEWDRFKKLRNHDPRVTRVGGFLRRTSLDELPQIFNVLKGEMSLFGPRPYLPSEEKDMGDYSDTILLTRPGITGLWQVSGRNELDFKGRLKLDAWYVLNWSLWLDIVILIKTIKVVLKMEGAY
jgi:undecaprenyl-phosphate galactose phosphotransferase